MNAVFPQFATDCLNKIEAAGFEAWFVGGAVRDSLIGREFYDVDITTNATPDEIIALFPKTVPTGIKHGTVTVIIDGNPVEVTTYRSESGYDDSRHPTEVNFETTIDADLSRRDFTINALAYNPKRGILDLFGGMDDLKKGVIRAVGDPYVRFTEDALRILRAFRFASVLAFKIEPDTEKAALTLFDRLSFLSGERVLSELAKLSGGRCPDTLAPLCEKGALLPFGIGKMKDVSGISALPSEHRLALFIHRAEQDLALIKANLKPSNKLLEELAFLNRAEGFAAPLRKADLKLVFAENAAFISLYRSFIALNCNEPDGILALFDEISENHEPYLIEHLALSGGDLKSRGISGEEIGRTLHKLQRAVIDDPSVNTREKLLSLI